MEKSFNLNDINGVGISARPTHFSNLLESKQFPWVEFLADNYLVKGSFSRVNLCQLAEIYPLVFHCVGMSIGSSEDFNWDYMRSLKDLTLELSPKWISDHLCFSSFNGNYYHDLIPIPYTLENAKYISTKIQIAQDFFGIPFLIENVSNYMTYSSNEMSESQFLNEIAKSSGCKLLLDVNNIYVNSENSKFDPYRFIDDINLDQVAQIHLAGFKDMQGYLIDTHSSPVHDSVFDLYRYTLRKSGRLIPTCLEWDEDIPTFKDFKREYDKIEKAYHNAST